MAEPKVHEGVAAELQALLCVNLSRKNLQCVENDPYVLYAVLLEALDNLISVDQGYSEAGSWSVVFKERAQLESSLSTLRSEVCDARRKAAEAEAQAKTSLASRDACVAAYQAAVGINPKDPARALSQRVI